MRIARLLTPLGFVAIVIVADVMSHAANAAVESNRIALNRISANRIAFNRIAFNRIAFNRIAFNGTATNNAAVERRVGVADGSVSRVLKVELPN